MQFVAQEYFFKSIFQPFEEVFSLQTTENRDVSSSEKLLIEIRNIIRPRMAL